MSISVKNNGTWALVKSVYVRQAGVWVPVQKVLEKNAGTWTQVYAAEVVATISANTNNVVVQSLFSAADWADQKKKRVEILPGVVMGSTSAGTPALRTGTGGVGEIIINNAGSIHGAGGAANSGAGGHAINVQQTGITINNSGAIRGGGGGGGRGGTGGPGFYYSTVTQGPYYSRSNPLSYWARQNGTNMDQLYWQGTGISGGSKLNEPYVSGGYSYSRYGNPQSTESSSGEELTTNFYQIIRTYQQANGTSGGGGGNGGRGQGSDGSLTAGSGGAAGGTNAGTGGTGGNGGNWGLPGNTGGVGGGGNNGGGTGGTAGGAAGAAIIGTARTLNNTGTINGAT